MAVELHLTPDDRWPIEVDLLLEATAKAGFVGVGMFRRWVGDTTMSTLARHGLRCSEMLALLLRDDAERTVARAEQLAEAAAKVGADWVLTVFETPLTPDSVALAQRCAEVLAEGGTAMALEFTPLGPVDTLTKGLELATVAGHGAKVIIDSWHVCLGPTNWDDLERVPLGQIAYVQFDDAMPSISSDARDESTNRRTLPGLGTLDLDRFSTTLLERGWEGAVSVEVLGDAVGLAVPELVTRCHQTAARFWL